MFLVPAGGKAESSTRPADPWKALEKGNEQSHSRWLSTAEQGVRKPTKHTVPSRPLIFFSPPWPPAEGCEHGGCVCFVPCSIGGHKPNRYELHTSRLPYPLVKFTGAGNRGWPPTPAASGARTLLGHWLLSTSVKIRERNRKDLDVCRSGTLWVSNPSSTTFYLGRPARGPAIQATPEGHNAMCPEISDSQEGESIYHQGS